MNKSLNELRDEAWANAESHGFHEQPANFGERLMLIVSELADALEADRNGEWFNPGPFYGRENMAMLDKACMDALYAGSLSQDGFEQNVSGTVEDEIADALIRILDLAGIYKINLDFHVAAKMKHNEGRPHKHGKKYG